MRQDSLLPHDLYYFGLAQRAVTDYLTGQSTYRSIAVLRPERHEPQTLNSQQSQLPASPWLCHEPGLGIEASVLF